MLKPIPRQILSDTMVLHIPKGIDTDYNTQYDNLVVERVHLQDDHSILKQTDNTEVQTRGILFIDAHLSSPRLDYIDIQEKAHKTGAGIRLTVRNRDYEVLTIDAVPDDYGQVHHYEVTVV